MRVVIEGLAEVQEKLHKLGRDDFYSAAMKAIGLEIMGATSIYPPETAANQPGPKPWYERGFGTRWFNADGAMGGVRTSETLSKKWFTTLQGNGVEIRNDASYAPLVHGELQMPFHGYRGWKKLWDTAKEKLPEAIEKLKAQVNKLWK